MNYGVVIYVLGWIMDIEAACMMLPCLVAVIYGENEGFGFLYVAIAAAVVGTIIVLHKPKDMKFYLKEGFVTTALSWIILSVLGALPFVLNEDIPDITDALFETVSGFTTTGSTILSDVEALSHASLFWRSFTHWIGGMGVLVFLLAILPMAGGSNMNLMKAESPGPSVGKLVPKVKDTAFYLYAIYFVMTVIEVILLIIGGMNLFESLTISFGTAGNGGLSIWNDSIMSCTPYQQWVIGIFMVLFGVNFTFYFLLITGKLKQALKIEEVRVYFIIVLVSVITIAINIYDKIGSIGATVRHSFFQVSSIITTTGYGTADFDTWPALSKTILVMLMFIGACAGSTGGGIKVSRFIVMAKTVRKEIVSFLFPKSVKKIKIEDKVIGHETLRSINVYFMTYILVFSVSLLLISYENKDMTSNFTAVAATINNIGPGLSKVGPTCNFSCYSAFSKYIFMFDMLAGRLELFPILLLFSPSVWKRKKKAA